MTQVTICIPSIPKRAVWLGQAVASVARQTVPCQVSVYIDHERQGAWHARNIALREALASTDPRGWIGFLDDDDYLLPHHVEHLLSVAEEHNASLVWPWFSVDGGTDPFPDHRGRQFDPVDPHIFPITYLVRHGVIHHALIETGGFQPDVHGTGDWETQDLPMVMAMWKASGGAFRASPERSWVWRHHANNTSGLPSR